MIADSRKMPGPVIILGMHRSGTSCLAGSLEEAGLFLGDINKQAAANLKGNRENRTIMNLHEDIFSDNNASWDAPRQALIWSDDHIARRQAIIDGYPSDRTWGFKDPRTLMLLDGWIEVLPNARFVGTFRHPHAVARSLRIRNGFTAERAIRIWTVYNDALLGFRKKIEFDVINFDLPPVEYLEKIKAISSRLGFDHCVGDQSFFDPDLRSNTHGDEDIGDLRTLQLYRELMDISK